LIEGLAARRGLEADREPPPNRKWAGGPISFETPRALISPWGNRAGKIWDGPKGPRVQTHSNRAKKSRVAGKGKLFFQTVTTQKHGRRPWENPATRLNFHLTGSAAGAALGIRFFQSRRPVFWMLSATGSPGACLEPRNSDAAETGPRLRGPVPPLIRGETLINALFPIVNRLGLIPWERADPCFCSFQALQFLAPRPKAPFS